MAAKKLSLNVGQEIPDVTVADGGAPTADVEVVVNTDQDKDAVLNALENVRKRLIAADWPPLDA